MGFNDLVDGASRKKRKQFEVFFDVVIGYLHKILDMMTVLNYYVHRMGEFLLDRNQRR